MPAPDAAPLPNQSPAGRVDPDPALEHERNVDQAVVIDCDPRRLHVFHSLWRESDGALLATAEQLFLHVDTVARRAAPAGAEVYARVQRLQAAHAALPRPERAGRAIGIVRS